MQERVSEKERGSEFEGGAVVSSRLGEEIGQRSRMKSSVAVGSGCCNWVNF